MSWQQYVDNQICAFVTCKVAIIASLQDGTIWAEKQNPEIKITQQELKTIADTMKLNPRSFQEKGIFLGGNKYLCLNADPDAGVVRGRKDGSALCIVSTKSCLLIVATVDNFQPGTLNTVVEGLGEYLKTHQL